MRTCVRVHVRVCVRVRVRMRVRVSLSVRVRVRVRVRVLLRVHIYKRQKKVVPFSPPISAKPALLSSKSFLKIVSRLEMR